MIGISVCRPLFGMGSSLFLAVNKSIWMWRGHEGFAKPFESGNQI